MTPADILRRKRDGQTLTAAEIESFVQGVTARTWPEYQASALLMAIFLRGMDEVETAALTKAMVDSGIKLDFSDLPGPKVDKHSTGGVGDKTSLILAPLAADCGVYVPMMSGRGLGHTGGTLDKLEAIPGFRVHLTQEEFRPILRDVGCIMIGATKEVAPADRILYALRDVTATVESIPLITASIMSKKIAEGIDALVLDVKAGKGAFMKTRADAHALARSLVANGRANRVRTEAVITAMDHPLGRMVGNALETRESIETLRGNGPNDLEQLSVDLAARMVYLGGLTKTLAEAAAKVRESLRSGRGLEKLRRIIERQGGDPRVIDKPDLMPVAAKTTLIRAERSGYVKGIDAQALGRATMVLGAGRMRVEDTVDHAVGAIVLAKPGQQVKAGEPLAELHHRDDATIAKALDMLKEVWTIGDEPESQMDLILDEVKD
jgi:pyrimidine-nucleoside phosphorylase